MADIKLKKRIRDLLKTEVFDDPDDLVDVSDGDTEDSIHVVVVSRKFDQVPFENKEDMIWSLLQKELSPDEWGKVTLSVAVSPAELKAI